MKIQIVKICKAKHHVLLFAFLLILFNTNMFAQESLIVSGKISDKQTGKPIPYTTVSILHQSIGTLTNEFGEFKFYIPTKYKNDSISFSCLGYDGLLLPVIECTGEGEKNQINLNRKLYSLDEIEIVAKRERSLRAEEIIQKAILNINSNYPSTPFILQGYFRDYLKDKEGYLNLLEAAVKIEDMGFIHPDFENSKFQILQTRFNPDYKYAQDRNVNFDNKNKYIPNAILSPVGGNELSVLRVHDPIRNFNRFSFSFIDVFEKDFIQNHTFQLDSITLFEGQYVYCINFSKKDLQRSGPGVSTGYTKKDNSTTKEEYRIIGTIFVSAGDYAIHKLVYTNYQSDDHINDYLYNFVAEYKKYQDKMYLNYLSFSNYFEMMNFSDSAYFKLDSAIYDPVNNKLILSFNNNLNPISAKHGAKYAIKYKNKKIKIRSFLIQDEKKLILQLVPFGHIKYYSLNDFKIKITKLEDVFGNLIDKAKTISLYQYREFFVNKIETDDFVPIPSYFLRNKTTPLYLLKKDDNPKFWETYNIVQGKKLLK